MNEPPGYHDLYDQLAEATGTTPGQALEQQLARLYERHPHAYAAQTRDVIAAWQAGRINSPWPFLRAAMERIDQHRPTTEHAGPERERDIRLAETWIRNAGLYAPLAEVEAELYGHSVRLAPYTDDAPLRTRIVELWHNQQPRAEQAQREQAERAAGLFKPSEAP